MSTDDQPAGVLPVGQVNATLPPSISSLRFSKQQRLLLPQEFKAVFDHNTLKASHPSLLLLAKIQINGSARLGLVITKKHVRLAVQRNRVKRLLRESFRHHQQALFGLDIVALARPGLGKLDNTQMKALFDTQWQRLLKQKKKQQENA